MPRNRPTDSSRRAQPTSARKIDISVLVVSTLTVFFATLFAALLLRRETSEPLEPMPADSASVLTTPRVTLPPVDLPQVDAPPPERNAIADPMPAPALSPALRTQLEQLGVKCAEGASCYSD